ncbi:primase-helicase family protein [Bradyrhizobium sp. 45]|uniref:primase-helicase family protein n=1 Tax=Bradyrhizobium sp. 45 TaxID=1043587 RepID=UPI001FF88151|nr:primase-helicase family protein [Bradyrhizobium sp. 45]MCK1311803.1 hypothetical protein [Bradyrhizobium sp. 45]
MANAKSGHKAILDILDADDAPPEIQGINRHHAFTMWGSKAVVVYEDPSGPLQIRTIDAFKAWFANRRIQTPDPTGTVRSSPLGQAWLSHPQRRQYEGVEFFPNPDGAEPKPNHLNLWRGFSVAPSSEGKWGILKDHLSNNVCNGDAELFDYVFGWFAHIVQRPRDKLGTALVLRGKMGTGKSRLGEVFGSLFPAHYLQIDSGRYLTGQFNGHMTNCLLLQSDEAVWAGDKSAEGRLKGLITSEYQMIESKGLDPIKMPNYVRCIMTSNEGWVVPAGKDERRFCVLDVHPRCAQNHDYFGEMEVELNNGGRERLLFDLLHFDLSKVNLRRIPRTKGLLDQKLRSLDSVETYWYGRLSDGTTTSQTTDWVGEISTDLLFEDYVRTSSQIGEKRRVAKPQFGEAIQKFGVIKRRPTIRDEHGNLSRVYRYAFPHLREARAKFEEILGQQIDWRAPTDETEDTISNDREHE